MIRIEIELICEDVIYEDDCKKLLIFHWTF